MCSHSAVKSKVGRMTRLRNVKRPFMGWKCLERMRIFIQQLKSRSEGLNKLQSTNSAISLPPSVSINAKTIFSSKFTIGNPSHHPEAIHIIQVASKGNIKMAGFGIDVDNETLFQLIYKQGVRIRDQKSVRTWSTGARRGSGSLERRVRRS